MKNLLGVEISSTSNAITTNTVISDTREFPWMGSFICSGKKLTSLEYGPRILVTRLGESGSYVCDNNELTALEHCATEISGFFSCYGNKLTSLKDIHKQLTKMNGEVNAQRNPIKSHVLGVLLIDGCKRLYLDNGPVQEIINNYLPNKEGRKGLLKCKGELVDAGYEEYAQL